MAKQTEGLSFYRRKKKINSKHIREVFSWILSILIVVFAACALVMLFGMTSNVVGISMEPGLKSEQRILVDRFKYVLGKPKAGDVILFLPNGNENAHYYTKRVVAVPGDTVIIENGRLYVNGELSKVVTQYIYDAGIAENEIVLETGQYFVMGDAPSDSEDSRSSGLGPVDIEDIVGRVWYKLPCDDGKMGFVK